MLSARKQPQVRRDLVVGHADDGPPGERRAAAGAALVEQQHPVRAGRMPEPPVTRAVARARGLPARAALQEQQPREIVVLATGGDHLAREHLDRAPVVRRPVVEGHLDRVIGEHEAGDPRSGHVSSLSQPKTDARRRPCTRRPSGPLAGASRPCPAPARATSPRFPETRSGFVRSATSLTGSRPLFSRPPSAGDGDYSCPGTGVFDQVQLRAVCEPHTDERLTACALEVVEPTWPSPCLVHPVHREVHWGIFEGGHVLILPKLCRGQRMPTPPLGSP